MRLSQHPSAPVSNLGFYGANISQTKHLASHEFRPLYTYEQALIGVFPLMLLFIVLGAYPVHMHAVLV